MLLLVALYPTSCKDMTPEGATHPCVSFAVALFFLASCEHALFLLM